MNKGTKSKSAKSKPMIAYHFTNGATLQYSGQTLPPVGEWLEVADTPNQPIQLCCWGLHASRHPLDALKYAPGLILHKVEMGEMLDSDEEKLVSDRRRIIASIDATELVLRFARQEACRVSHLYDCPKPLKHWLKTGEIAVGETFESLHATAQATAHAATAQATAAHAAAAHATAHAATAHATAHAAAYAATAHATAHAAAARATAAYAAAHAAARAAAARAAAAYAAAHAAARAAAYAAAAHAAAHAAANDAAYAVANDAAYAVACKKAQRKRFALMVAAAFHNQPAWERPIGGTK